MSNLYFPYDSRYGCEIFSRERSIKVNNNTAGLPLYSEFYLHLINNTFNPVVCNLIFDGQIIGTYTIQSQSTQKVLNYNGTNQFFKFSPHTESSKLKFEWIPVITKYKYIEPIKKEHIVINNKYRTPTMLNYDRRINYGCTQCKHNFVSDLEISFNKVAKSYVNGATVVQEIILTELSPKYNIFDVRDYFVYNPQHLDIPNKQLMN